MTSAASATLSPMIEMFEGFWGWPISQKAFGLLWLFTLLGLIVAFGVVIYLAA